MVFPGVSLFENDSLSEKRTICEIALGNLGRCTNATILLKAEMVGDARLERTTSGSGVVFLRQLWENLGIIQVG